MSFASRLSPARVTQAAATKLPRLLLLALLLAYLGIGLGGHDPWPDDGIAFGAMWTMAHGTAPDWLFPNVAGIHTNASGPLPLWFGALALRASAALLGSDIAAPLASRLPALGWFGIACAALWYAAYRLARRDAAQPVVLAFGGHADPRDYARMLADVAALLFIGTLGIVLRWHEATIDGATIAFGAVALYGTTRAIARPLAGGLLCGVAAAGLGLSVGPLPGLGLLAGSVVAFGCAADGGVGSVGESGGARLRRFLLAAGPAILLAALLLAAWPLFAMWRDPHAARGYFAAGFVPWGPQPIAAQRADLAWLARNAGWYLWPLWPLATWALYAWRSVPSAVHITRPACLVAGALAGGLLCAPVGELTLAPLVAPLAALAAFGGTTLRRAADNLMDWLAAVLFTFAAVFVWSYFLAMVAAVPPRMAASVAHLAPGFHAVPHPAAMAWAVGATCGWLGLVAWRAVRRSSALWRGPLLAAAGTTMLWSVMVALFMPAFDYTQSHRDLALEIARHVTWRSGDGISGDCLQAHRIPLPQRALIAFHGALRFGRGDDGEACSLALQRISGTTVLDEDPPPGHPGSWRLIWEGHRPARPAETWRLWQRQPR